MKRPQRAPAAALVDTPIVPCGCGNRSAPFGIGPPLAEAKTMFCLVCWQFQPSTQALFAERCLEAIGEAA